MADKTVSVNLLGCLPFLIGMLILGSLGFFGNYCQEDIHNGITKTRQAITGETK